MPGCRPVSGGREGNSWEGTGPPQPGRPLQQGSGCALHPQHPAPHWGHHIRHWAPCSRLGNPRHWEKASLRNHPRRRDGECAHSGCRHGTVPATILVLLRGAAAARKRRGLPGHPPELCEECPCARVATRQALSRHIPNVRAPGSTGDSRPRAREQGGSSPRTVPSIAPMVLPARGKRPVASQLPGQHKAPQGMGNPGPQHPRGGTVRAPQHPAGGQIWEAAPGRAVELPAAALTSTPRLDPSPCGNSPGFAASQQGPIHCVQAPLPFCSGCGCSPLLSRESGKLHQPHGFLGRSPASRQR